MASLEYGSYMELPDEHIYQAEYLTEGRYFIRLAVSVRDFSEMTLLCLWFLPDLWL